MINVIAFRAVGNCARVSLLPSRAAANVKTCKTSKATGSPRRLLFRCIAALLCFAAASWFASLLPVVGYNGARANAEQSSSSGPSLSPRYPTARRCTCVFPLVTAFKGSFVGHRCHSGTGFVARWNEHSCRPREMSRFVPPRYFVQVFDSVFIFCSSGPCK